MTPEEFDLPSSYCEQVRLNVRPKHVKFKNYSEAHTIDSSTIRSTHYL